MHFCGVSERMGDGSAMLKLPTLTPSWFLDGDLPNMDRDTFRRAIKTACSRWEAVCGLRFSEASRVDQATLRIITHDLGGPGGVLADQQLPFAGMRQLLMRVDRGERWGIYDTPTGNGIDIVRVLTHELGHFLSLQHFDPNPPAELMEPTYSATVIAPQPTEARMVVSMYGPPTVTPPAPGGQGVTTVQIDWDKGTLAIPGYRVTKLSQ